MRITPPQSWDVTPREAIAIQQALRDQVIMEDQFGPLHRVGGVDVGFEEGGKITRAAVAVLSLPDLQLQETAIARRPTSFPYVPGLLSFRETPAVLDALSQLNTLPDLLMCDGHGLAHPRRFGIACHLGLLCDLPSIGVAKSLLVGQHVQVGETRGDWQPLLMEEDGIRLIIGAALRTRSRTKTVYVSIGHRISLETAIGITLSCVDKYRLPEPARMAHHLASGS